MESRVTDYRSPEKFSRLFKSEWLTRLKELYEHKNAPIYNSYCGDRHQAEDLPELENLNKITLIVNRIELREFFIVNTFTATIINIPFGF